LVIERWDQMLQGTAAATAEMRAGQGLRAPIRSTVISTTSAGADADALGRGGKAPRDPMTGMDFGHSTQIPVAFGGMQGLVMYRWVYWGGVTVFVIWSAFSAYSVLNGF
jgi:hypothetical protein